MRLAFVDVLFSWPPHGGACTDLFYTARGLANLGHDVHLFMAAVPGMGERSGADLELLPFDATKVTFNRTEFTPEVVANRFKSAVDSYRPDAVFVCDAFFVKPHLIDALSAYPLAVRYYAYEANCPRDFRRFLHGARCPKDYFVTPDFCRRCAVDGMGPELKRGEPYSGWVQEYLATRAYLPDYYRRLKESLARPRALIVYNEVQKALLIPVNEDVFIVPGGVEIDQFEATPLPERAAGERHIIVMAGRCEDPAKGMTTLGEAAQRVAQQRSDFEVWVTHTDHSISTDTFKAVGWKSHDEIINLYQQAAICVVPSLWEEPFGMVAVEAMAAGRPVIAARGGGLTNIVEDGETGFLFEAGNAADLAERIVRLLDDASLRSRMASSARVRVAEHYAWDHIIERHYPPILERLQA